MVFSFRGYLYNTDDCVLYQIITDKAHNLSNLATIAKIDNSQVDMNVQLIGSSEVPLGVLNRIKSIEEDRINNFVNIKVK